jgi:hypothetical protein
MTEEEIIRSVSRLPGAVVVTAGEANGAPEVAWGDSFFFYDPEDLPANRQLPFATIVTNDYDGFDTASNLHRPGVFRLNVAVGRARFENLLGYPPAEHAGRSASVDYAALDQILPHPVYAAQGWLSILCPGPRTSGEAHSLITFAHQRAMARHRPASA